MGLHCRPKFSHGLILMMALALCGQASAEIMVTPWCQHSFRVQVAAPSEFLDEGTPLPLPKSALQSTCGPGKTTPLKDVAINGNLKVELFSNGSLGFSRVDTQQPLMSVAMAWDGSKTAGYSQATVQVTPSQRNERFYGLGQGEWTKAGGMAGGCSVNSSVVPFVRNGQVVSLLQRKFHVTIPFVYSSAGYGFLFNMPGYGQVSLGKYGEGGMNWVADATVKLDFWVTTLPQHTEESSPAPIYSNYADATGHAPMLRENAMIFWQSRNRYKSNAVALAVAKKYEELKLPVGVLVIDYKNQVADGDFNPNPDCYDVAKLVSGIRESINATTTFSFWPEALQESSQYDFLKQAGCLINSDLGGRAIDATLTHCRTTIQEKFLKPNYVSKGVTAYWLDESDGEGTAGGDGDHGYDTR